MGHTLSVRLDPKVTRRLDVFAKRSKRSKSSIAAAAIANYIDTEEWQRTEIREGVKDLNAGRTVRHDDVSAWLASWGSAEERKPPQ